MAELTGQYLVTVRRSIAASAEELFDAWLDADMLAQFMRPGGMARASVSCDPREGGAFEIIMHGDDSSYRHTGHYLTIERPRKLVFSWISAATAERESLVTVDFIAGSAATDIVVTHRQLPDEAAQLSHTEGWGDVLDVLAALFP
ncbi:SRPBCC domain-containing protein [Oxalobacteraceae bacterium]|nr:SRPBCC domain-containing protein [Oxalobacteraceae bacterium]